MKSLRIVRIDGQWHGWSDCLKEWLPLPLTPEASENEVRSFYAARGSTVVITDGVDTR